jgi:RNA polymerase sigma factor (sigma-70 family)
MDDASPESNEAARATDSVARRATRAFARYRAHGDAEAMTSVFDLLAPQLHELASRLVGRGADAEDVVQATFLAALERAERFDPTRSVLPWLVGILVREARTVRRRRSFQERGLRLEARAPDASICAMGPVRDVEPRTATDASAQLLAQEVRGAIAEAVAELPARQRAIVTSALEDEASRRAVAERLGIAPSTVRALLHRGLASLRRRLPPSLAPAVMAHSQVPRDGAGLGAVRAKVHARALQTGVRVARPVAATRLALPISTLMATKSLMLGAAALVAALLVFSFRPWSRAETLSVEVDRVVSAPEENAHHTPAFASPEAPLDSGQRSNAIVPEDAPSPFATLEVRVLDEAGRGVAGAFVFVEPTLEELGAGMRSSFEFQARSDEGGRAEVVVPPGRRLALRVARSAERSGAHATVEALEPGAVGTSDLRVRTRPDVRFSLRVVAAADGVPVEGAKVGIVARGWASDAEGNLELEAAGHTDVMGHWGTDVCSWRDVAVCVVARGFGAALIQPWIEATGGDATRASPPVTHEVRLLPAGRVVGQVLGAPPASRVVAEAFHQDLLHLHEFNCAREPHGSIAFRAAVAADGTFEFPDLPAQVRLHLSLHGRASEGQEVVRLWRDREAMILAPAETAHVRWDLSAETFDTSAPSPPTGEPAPPRPKPAPTASLSLRAVAVDGVVVPCAARFYVLCNGATSRFDADGFAATARLASLPAGHTTVLAVTDDRRIGAGTVELEAGRSHSLDVRVGGGGRVRFQRPEQDRRPFTVTRDGEPFLSVRVPGSESYLLPVGTYEVRLDPPADAASGALPAPPIPFIVAERSTVTVPLD